jgi:hypothetical protein
MSACQSCGGANSPSATHCEYCDQPLGGRQLVEVAWSARTAGGASGQGRIAVEAPTGTSTDRLRALAEAAFASAVDAEGAEASAEQIQSAMGEGLGPLLPTDHTITTLEITSFQAFVLVGKAADAAEPAAAPSGAGRRTVSLGLLAVSLCCLSSGGVCMLGGVLKSEEAKVVLSAPIVSVDDAPSASGLICVEAAVAQVSSALVAAVADPRRAEVAAVETGIACLFLRETVTRTIRTPSGKKSSKKTHVTNRHVDSFKLGALIVEPTDATQFLGLETLPSLTEGDVRTTYKALRVSTQLTVIGNVNGGVMTAVSGTGHKVFVSSAAGRDAVAAELKTASRVGYQFGYVALALGGFVLFLSLVGFWRR